VEAAIHLDRAFLTTRAAPRQMYRQGTGGSIVYTGSVQSNHWSRNFRHDGLWPIIRLPRLCFTSAAPLVPSISAIR
jgi:NAD(P)-dependent dehydrogenase (short-subunit alcohol dehydrogenase family)